MILTGNYYWFILRKIIFEVFDLSMRKSYHSMFQFLVIAFQKVSKTR